jgi:hypothetical protein
MFPALYRMVCKNSKKKIAKKSLNVPNVKHLSKKKFSVFSFFMHFCWEWHLALCTLSDFPGIRNLSGLNAPTASTTLVASITSTASFHQKTYWVWCFLQSCTKLTYPGLSMWDNSPKIPYFIHFWHSFCWRLWRPWMLVLTNYKDHKSNVPYQWIHRQFFYGWKFNFRCPSKAFISRITLWNTL